MNIEALAESLCNERWGDGTWNKPKINRAYWRRQARRMVDCLLQELTNEGSNEDLRN